MSKKSEKIAGIIVNGKSYKLHKFQNIKPDIYDYVNQYSNLWLFYAFCDYHHLSSDEYIMLVECFESYQGD